MNSSKLQKLPFGLVTPVFIFMMFFALVPCANLLFQSLNPSNDSSTWPDINNFVNFFDSKIGQQALARTIRVNKTALSETVCGDGIISAEEQEHRRVFNRTV